MTRTPEQIEHDRAASRAWYAANRDQKKAYSKEYRLENPEKVKAALHNWYVKNAPKVLESNKNWRMANPEKVAAQTKTPKAVARERARTLRRFYNLTVEEYDAMSEKQGHVCLICKRGGKLVVDHCHETGEIRGLLCNHCNKGLGFFRDNPEALCAAIEYLGRGEKNTCQH